jgi:hypothetical protein
MAALKIIGYLVAGLFVIGIIVNAKDIKRYVRISSM